MADLTLIEDDLADGWLDEFAAEGLAALERLLAAYAEFARLYPDQPPRRQRWPFKRRSTGS